MTATSCERQTRTRSLTGAVLHSAAVLHSTAVLTLAAGDLPAQERQDRSASAGWSYVLPAVGEPMEHPPLRALTVSDSVPEGLEVVASFAGERQRFAQLRYGSPGSVRVGLVIDALASGAVDLYVDSDRDRRIEASDRVERLATAAATTWRIPLTMILHQDQLDERLPRHVVFRMGSTRTVLGFAAAGFMAGTVTVGGKELRCVRTDEDGNGFFTDERDCVMIDLDGDGRFDPLRERFGYAPVLTIFGERYALESDPRARSLTLSRIAGTGTVRLKMPGLAVENPEDVLAVKVTLVSRDGLTVALDDLDAAAALPIGDYRITNLRLQLADSESPLPWTYVFSTSGGRGDRNWHPVREGAQLDLDPLGELEFVAGLAPGDAIAEPGSQVILRPRLYTQDGLLINTCYLGSVDGFGGPGASVELLTGRGQVADSATSGFA